jgi:hypothetical protein
LRFRLTCATSDVGLLAVVGCFRHSDSQSVSLVGFAPQALRSSFHPFIPEEKVMLLQVLLNAGLEIIAFVAGFIDTITC